LHKGGFFSSFRHPQASTTHERRHGTGGSGGAGGRRSFISNLFNLRDPDEAEEEGDEVEVSDLRGAAATQLDVDPSGGLGGGGSGSQSSEDKELYSTVKTASPLSSSADGDATVDTLAARVSPVDGTDTEASAAAADAAAAAAAAAATAHLAYTDAAAATTDDAVHLAAAVTDADANAGVDADADADADDTDGGSGNDKGSVDRVPVAAGEPTCAKCNHRGVCARDGGCECATIWGGGTCGAVKSFTKPKPMESFRAAFDGPMVGQVDSPHTPALLGNPVLKLPFNLKPLYCIRPRPDLSVVFNLETERCPRMRDSTHCVSQTSTDHQLATLHRGVER
jgi:hypothetical protein